MVVLGRSVFLSLFLTLIAHVAHGKVFEHNDGHMVCANELGFSSITLVWQDAIFTIPKTSQKQVILSTVPNAIASSMCTLENLIPYGLFSLFHYLDQCGDETGRLSGRHLIMGGEVACAKDDDVCYVRASPFSSPCLLLPRSKQWDDIDIGKLEFWGYAISVFEGIQGVPFEDHSSLLFWEETLASIVSRNPTLSGLWRYPTYLVCATLVSLSSDAFVDNRAFQLLFAASFGVSIFLLLALLLLFLVFSHLFKISQQTPWGGFFVHSAFFLPPVAALCYRWLMSQLSSFIGIMGSFWGHGTCFLDPLGFCACKMCNPWIGKAYFSAGALIGIVVEMRTCFLKYPLWVYEEQQWNTSKCGQKHLERVLALLSFVLYSLSLSSDVSFLLALIMTKSVRSQIAHWYLLVHIANNKQPYYANGGRLKSNIEYEQDCKSTTERELAKLRSFIQQQQQHELEGSGGNQLRRACFDVETTRRLDSFRMGGVDVQRQRLEPQQDQLKGIFHSIQSTFVTMVVIGVCVACLFYS